MKLFVTQLALQITYGGTDMNCNCISEIEKKISASHTEKLGAIAEVSCQASGFAMADNSVRVIHKTDFKVTAQAKGWTRGKMVPVIASFCPFCGTKAD